MSTPKVIVRKGDPGIVKTAIGPRPPTPIEPQQDLLVPQPIVAKGSPPPRTEEPPSAQSAFTRRGGRVRRGRKTQRRSRRHRGGGVLSVIQDGPVWRIKETAPDGQAAVSPRTFASFEEAATMSKSLKTIKGMTPDQPERRAIARAADALSRVTKTETSLGGTRRRRRRHH